MNPIDRLVRRDVECARKRAVVVAASPVLSAIAVVLAGAR